MPPRRFNTVGDCRRYLASLIIRVESGEMDHVKASKLSFICVNLVRTMEQTVLEERLVKLEIALAAASQQNRPLTIVGKKGK